MSPISPPLRRLASALPYLAAAWLLASPARAHAACAVGFATPRAVAVTGHLTELIFDDACEHVYLTNATSNRVEVFSIADDELQTPIAVGSQPTGLDVSPDGTTLYVANSGGNNISIVDLTAGVEQQKVTVPSNFINDKPFSVAVASTGLVLFSTTFAGSGFGGRMMQLDPSSYALAQRTDFFINGTTTEATFLRASADRSVIAAVAGDISSAPVFRYSSATDQFSKEKDLDGFVTFVATDESGATIVVDPGTSVLDASLSLSGTITGGGFGVAVHPAGTIGYRVRASSIDVLDLVHFLTTGTLAVGDTVANANAFSHGVGQLAISRDGALLAVITDHGFTLVQTDAPVVTTPTPTATPAHTPTQTGTPAAPPTPTATPEGLPLLDKSARRCEAALATHARAFAITDHKLLQKCFDGLLREAARGRDTTSVAAKCAEWTNPANPDSVLARARATAAANALRACGSVSAAELGTPCARDAATLADVIGCTLDAYEAGVDVLIAATYTDACALADVAGIGAMFANVCSH